MAQNLTLKNKGLWTFPSDVSAVPEGALSQCDNVVIDRADIAEPRRGFDYLKHGATKSTFSNVAYRANKLFYYKGKTLCHYDTNQLAYHDPSTGWINYSGTYDRPAATVQVRSAQANQNLYFTNLLGVYKLDAFDGTPRTAGMPAALDNQLSVASTPPATWLTNHYRTSYRVVWGIKDANANVILGAPSQRDSSTNTSGSAIAIQLVFTVPAGITTANFFQIYRAQSVDNTSAVVEPSDEMGLVYEGNPSPTDISNKYITVVDIVPDTLLGAKLYTSPSQEGFANANQPPPGAYDLAVFRGCLFYGNTYGIQNIYLTLLGVAGGGSTIPTGIAADDTLTIGATTFTAKAAESIASRQFQVVTTGSASQNIHDTAASLVRVINRYASSPYYAYYLSGANDLPGKMYITARTVGAAAFSVTSSKTTCWNPVLESSGTSQTSSADVLQNAVFFSKPSEPEAVPLANYLYIGSADKAILRVMALRDSLFILKEDGIFRVYGTDPSNFQVTLLDSTANLIAPETAVAMNNQIYCFTTQGVVNVSETGVSIISHPIELDLTSLITENYTALQNTSFGVSYESQRSYYLWLITGATDTYPTQYYKYNYITQCWVRGTLAKLCGGVNPLDDKLYLGSATSNIIDVERKDLAYTDYADYQTTQTITAVAGTLVHITSADTIFPGSIVYQSATVFGEVQSVDAIAGTITTTLPVGFTLGAADVLSPISCAIAWTPVSFRNPGMSKHIREISMLFNADFTGLCQVGFSSDVSPGVIDVQIDGGANGGWGLFAWGGPSETPLGANWGGDSRRRPIRALVPRVHQRCSIMSISFNHAYAYSHWKLQGVSVIGDGIGERIGQ